MKAVFLSLAGAVLVGCAAQPMPAPSLVAVSTAPDASSALAFDPPITQDVVPLDLSRDTRGPAAFYGYQDSSISYFDTYTSDRRTTDSTDRLNRETYSEKVGDVRR